MMIEPMRFDPGGSPADFQTFGVRQHVRPSPCSEVGCSAHRNGWRTTMLAGSDAEAYMLQVCRGEIDGHRRAFITIPQGGYTQYVFDAGQVCFAVSRHQVAVQRPPVYLRRDGDWRAGLGNVRRYDRGDQWMDDIHTRHDRIAHIRQTRG